MSVSLSDIDRVYLNNKAMATIVKSISNPPITLWAMFVPFCCYDVDEGLTLFEIQINLCSWIIVIHVNMVQLVTLI